MTWDIIYYIIAVVYNLKAGTKCKFLFDTCSKR